jgi:vitamin B12 transporter
MHHRTVLIALFLLIIPAVLVAERTIPEQIDEIVVTARRTAENASQTPANITVLTADDLAKLPAHNLADALGLVSGVDIQGRGGFNQPSSLSIQGASPSHTRIMVDGILMNTQGAAFANPSLIPLGNIERIEVVKGAGSALWGSSLGGVINVITRQAPDNGSPVPKGSLTFTAGAGDTGFYQQTLALSGRSGKVGYLFWNNHVDTDSGFRTNSAALNDNVAGKVNYEISDTAQLLASYNYTSQQVGGYEFDTLGYGEDYRYFTRYGAIGLVMKPDNNLDLNATLKSSDQDSTLTRFAVPGNALIAKSTSHDVFTGLDIGSALRLDERQSVSAGLDLGQDKLNSDLMTETETLGRYGLYANYQRLALRDLNLQTGLRYDANTAYGNQFSPSAGAVYSLPADTKLRLSVSRAFNAPPLIYRFITGAPGLIPNDQLKAERGLVYETSVATKPLKDLTLKVGLYRAEVTDLVNFVEIVPFTTYQAQNVDKVRRQGMETEVKYGLSNDVSARAGFEYNRVQNRATGQLVKDNGVAKAAYHLGLEYGAKPTGASGAPTNVGIANTLQASLLGNYNFWNEPPASSAIDRRFIWDAHLSYELAGVLKQSASAFINLYNIFNRPYYYNLLLPNPGRQVEFGMRYNF